MDKVSAKRRDFGILLGLTTNQLDAWDEKDRGDAHRIWNRVMEYWLDRDTREYPATWDGLCTLLTDVNCSNVAKELSEAVSKASIHTWN